MYIEKYDIKSIKSTFKKCKNQEILEEFQNSEFDCVKVLAWNNSSAHSCVNSLNASIKRFKLLGLKAITRKDEVFLIKIQGRNEK